MKILFHINCLGRGGAERVVSVLSDYFAKDGNTVVVTTLWQDLEEYPLNKAVRRISVGLKAGEQNKGRIYKLLARFFRLRKAIKTEKPDIVVSFCASANFRCAYSMAGINIPLLVSVRNDPQSDYVPYKRATRHMVKKAAGCVFQTKAAMESFPKDFQKKSRVIFNPIDESFLEYGGLNKDISQREPRIVTVGRVTRQKNQLLLVRAFERIHDELPQYTLEIYGEVGDGVVKGEIADFCNSTGIADKVKFMGVSDTVYKDISSASLFVLSSEYEGMPNALMEAMALGLPVISTDCPCYGPSTLIEQGKSGILVPMGDVDTMVDDMAAAMKKVLGCREYAQGLGENAAKIKNLAAPNVIYQEWKQYVDDIERQFRE